MSFVCKHVRAPHPFSDFLCLGDLQHADELHYCGQYRELARVCAPDHPGLTTCPFPASAVSLHVVSKLSGLS